VAPENTVEAFRIALGQGADGVELDVHRSADDGLIVHHDAEVPGLGLLSALPLARIREARPDIPTLTEALDVCAGSLVNVEIKNLPGDADFDETDHAASLVVELLRARQGRDDVLVSSFNLHTVDRVRALDESVRTAFLVVLGIDPFDALSLCADRGHVALHPFVGLLAGEAAGAVVARAASLRIAVNVWTVNDETEIARLGAAGVGAIITDLPDVARRVIPERSAPRG
jgi:glycerophosphoryl diester phosphodiesterase